MSGSKLTPKFVHQWLESAWRDGFKKGLDGRGDMPDFTTLDPRRTRGPATKIKISNEESSMLPFDESHCCARMFKGGFGVQCTRGPLDDHDFCKIHQKKFDSLGDGLDVPFGRYNGERPIVSLDRVEGNSIKWTHSITKDKTEDSGKSSDSARPLIRLDSILYLTSEVVRGIVGEDHRCTPDTHLGTTPPRRRRSNVKHADDRRAYEEKVLESLINKARHRSMKGMDWQDERTVEFDIRTSSEVDQLKWYKTDFYIRTSSAVSQMEMIIRRNHTSRISSNYYNLRLVNKEFNSRLGKDDILIPMIDAMLPYLRTLPRSKLKNIMKQLNMVNISLPPNRCRGRITQIEIDPSDIREGRAGSRRTDPTDPSNEEIADVICAFIHK